MLWLQKFQKDQAGTNEARMPLPEPNDLDKAGMLKFEELEGSLRNLNKDIQCKDCFLLWVFKCNFDSPLDCVFCYVPAIELKADQVIAASEETHLEPFKGKMESFFAQGMTLSIVSSTLSLACSYLLLFPCALAKQSLSEEEENLEECKQKLVSPFIRPSVAFSRHLIMQIFFPVCRFQAVLKFFKYTPKKSSELDPKDFFSLWSSFASDFKDAWNREQQRIHKEK